MNIKSYLKKLKNVSILNSLKRGVKGDMVYFHLENLFKRAYEH